MARRNFKVVELPEETQVEVVMRKVTTYKDYRDMMQGAKSKGWFIQAFKLEVATDPLNEKV